MTNLSSATSPTSKDRTPPSPRANGQGGADGTPLPPLPADLSRRSSDASAAALAKGEGAEAEASTAADAALPVALATLSDDVLEALAAAVPREIAARKAKREADFFALVREQAIALGLTPARLAAALAAKSAPRPRADGRSVVKPKFRNPHDAAQTWAGRGAPPKWYADHLAAGGSEADMRIPDGA